jgi:hypothetical protein
MDTSFFSCIETIILLVPFMGVILISPVKRNIDLGYMRWDAGENIWTCGRRSDWRLERNTQFILFAKYYKDDQIKEGGMGRTV